MGMWIQTLVIKQTSLIALFIIAILIGLVCLVALNQPVQAQSMPSDSDSIEAGDDPSEPLPRYLTDEEERLMNSIEYNLIRQQAVFGSPSGIVWTPGEYEPIYALLISWDGFYSLLTELVAGITMDPHMDSLAMVVVDTYGEQANAYDTLEAAGADMDRVRFIIRSTDTVWIRDYGPSYISEDGQPAIIDHHYNRPRPDDDALPAWIGTHDIPFIQDEPVYLMDLEHGGGNFHVFSNGDAFMSDLILAENPAKSESVVKSIIEGCFNVDLTIYDPLPKTVDSTQHIDMWFLPVSDSAVIIGQFDPATGNKGYNQTEAAAADMAARGYTVYRVPNHNSGAGGSGGTHYTYTNAMIVNNVVFIPEYGGSHDADDAAALGVFEAAFDTANTDYEIVQLDCSSIIHSAGAIHCITKPVFAIPTPMVEVLTPNGGEDLGAGQKCQIKWIANDEKEISSVDLYYSVDGGMSYPGTIATDEPHDGCFTWTAPPVDSNQCLIKIVVHDSDANTSADISDAEFAVSTVPVVTTLPVEDTGLTTATFHGALNRPGTIGPVNVVFEYGTASGSYPYTVPVVESPISGTGSISAGVTGLSEGTTYYVRAKATGAKVGYGSELHFTETVVAPVSWWPLNSGTGNFACDAIGQNDGTVSGNVNWVAGVSGTALDFDGISTEVSLPNGTLKPAHITQSAWVYPGKLSGCNPVFCIESAIDGKTGAKLELTDGHFEFIIGNGTSGIRVASGTLTASERWYHVAGTYDGIQVCLWLNGKLQASKPLSGSISYSANGDIRIGSWDGGAPEYFKGKIDEIRLYDRALTVHDIRNLFDGEMGWPVWYYDRNDDKGIDFQEMISALMDYLTDNITYSQMVDVLMRYLVS